MMKIKDALINYCLRLADSNLVLSQRLAEWCSRGPILEEDLALSNISLDLLGQAEMIYEYVSSLNDNGKSADEIAFLRTEREYFNHVMAEQPNGDFACTMVRQFLISSFSKVLYESLSGCNDEVLKGITAKSLKEVRYHLRHSSEWLIRLGNGTEESHRRTQFAINELWRYTDDMFEMNETDSTLISAGIITDTTNIYGQWIFSIKELMKEANLQIPFPGNVIKGGYNGLHTEHLGHLLCEMQYLQRSYPGASW